jgi:hypothetical protein
VQALVDDTHAKPGRKGTVRAPKRRRALRAAVPA